MTRSEPTPQQMKAVANSLRLRVLRLCNDRAWTNKELADRLERDPATMLHHVRLLVDAGLLEPVAVRQGPSGAYEKPYRSTGLSWELRFDRAAEDEDGAGEPAMLAAFRQELAEAGNDSIGELTRFHLHLDEAGLDAFSERLRHLLDEFLEDDDARRRDGAPGHGGIVAVHRLADPPGERAGR
ncbi:MAG: ArsR/SmtB family transcription factor [Acidimicrobiales bacterium]